MTYTISTEPVTKHHVGKKFLGRNDEDEAWMGPYELVDFWFIENHHENSITTETRYFCVMYDHYFTQAILIVEN